MTCDVRNPGTICFEISMQTWLSLTNVSQITFSILCKCGEWKMWFGQWTIDNRCFYDFISAMEENEYRRLAKCPHSSLGGYAIVIQYLLIVKLIMVTLLYALFR